MTNVDEIIRRALDTEAATVEVRPDALATIRAATRRRRTRFTVNAWIGAGLATATAATVAFFVLDAPRPAPPERPAATRPTAVERLLAVYYVGPDRDDRLVREFHRVTPASDSVEDQARAALGVMFGGAPADPDYATAWPAGIAVRDVTVRGDVATVRLAGAASLTPIAAQQLVWTVTAIGGLKGVRIGGGAALRRASAVDTLAPVWLINPQEGETVGPDLDLHIAGFASTAHVRITDGTGRVVLEQDVALTGGSPAQGEANLGVAVRPGRYTVTVTAGGGTDDHSFQVG
ncbi:GerMN domain-containing protein [Asanoa sp. NPDC049573]|uniref:GerMN domain-containing protein n=1 Tax=Asanoa sp. NPDC049573 TaxID=3155396 RepID=UPI00343CAED5